MLNIFADALLIASRIGRLPESKTNRAPHEFQDVESLRAIDTLRTPLR